MDIFGLGKVGSSLAIAGVVVALLATLASTFRWWINEGKQDAIDGAAALSTIEALEIESARVTSEMGKAKEELVELETHFKEIEAASGKLRTLMQRNWDHDLQSDPNDFATRANLATAKQLFRAQGALDESLTPAGDM